MYTTENPTRRIIGSVFCAIATVIATGAILAACAPPPAKSSAPPPTGQPQPAAVALVPTATATRPSPTPTRIPPTATATKPPPTPTRIAPTPIAVQVSPTAVKASPTPAVVANLNGGTVVYFFFSTSCEYCAAQAPDMQKFFSGTGARVVGIPLHANQMQSEAFAKKYGLTFEVREDISLVTALGSVTRHPVIAFQGAPGATLVRASDGTISVQALTEKYLAFIKGGGSTPVQVNRGRG